METYLRLINRFPRSILILLLLITVFFLSQLPKLTADSNPYLLDASHPARRTILEMQKEFTGTFDAALITIYNKNGVFNRQTLDAIYELTKASRKLILTSQADEEKLRLIGEKYAARSADFAHRVTQVLDDGFSQNDYTDALQISEYAKKLPLNEEERTFLEFLPRRINPIKELAGLAATENIVAKNGILAVRNAIPDKQLDPEIIRQEVMGNRMMLRGVVAPDEKVTLIAVELFIKQEDAEGQLRAYRAFQQLVANYQQQNPEFTRDNQVFIAGVPIFIAEQKNLIDRDMSKLFPLVIAVVTTILVIFFRRPLGVMLPLINVVMAAIWTLGLMAMMRAPLDLITSALPVFLITICGADAIHMMSEYYTQRTAGYSPAEAAKRTTREMFSPVVLTTLTTLAGFLFATSTNISSIRSFGIYMACGLVFAQIIALTLVPCWIMLFGKKASRKNQDDSEAKHSWLGELLTHLFIPVLNHRKLFGFLFILILCGSGFMATKIHVEDAGSGYFAKNNPFRQADDFVNEHLAGTSPGWIEISKPGPRSMVTLDSVRFIAKLDAFLEKESHVTFTYSVPKYVQRMNLVMHDMDPAYDRLPQEKETVSWQDPDTGTWQHETISGDDIVSQSILMYENGGGSDLTNVLNSDFSKAVTLFTMNTNKASEYEALLQRLDDWLKQNKPSGYQIKLGGSPVIWTGVLHEIIKGQLTSFILAYLAVTLVLIFWLRSWRQGLLASIPLAATMICYYGLMSSLGIDLNIGTAIISFLIVGIVDYSVHYLHRIDSAYKQGMALNESLLYAIRHSGQSIAFNVLVFSCGFMTLLFSEFRPIIDLGILVAMALSISGCMSLFLITLLAPTFLQPSHPIQFESVDNAGAITPDQV